MGHAGRGGVYHGRVQIGAVSVSAETIIAPVVGRLRAHHPGLRFTVREGASADIEGAVLDGELEFGDYFEHVGRRGETPAQPDAPRRLHLQLASRLRSRREHRLGKPVAGDAEGASSASWMASPGHRANILDGALPGHRHRRLPAHRGARAHGQAGGIYTQDFGVIVTG